MFEIQIKLNIASAVLQQTQVVKPTRLFTKYEFQPEAFSFQSFKAGELGVMKQPTPNLTFKVSATVENKDPSGLVFYIPFKADYEQTFSNSSFFNKFILSAQVKAKITGIFSPLEYKNAGTDIVGSLKFGRYFNLKVSLLQDPQPKLIIDGEKLLNWLI